MLDIREGSEMTVGELIERLQELDPEIVILYTGPDECSLVREVSTRFVNAYFDDAGEVQTSFYTIR